MTQRPAVILLLCTVLLIVAVYSLEKEPHNFKITECPSCHQAGPSGTVQPDRLSAPVSMLCRDCHSSIFSEGYIHPVDVRPYKADVPLDMPLSGNGEITCNTCHNIHSSYFTPFGTPSRYLRRLETGKDFCRTCHKGLSFAKEGHRGALGEAHFSSKYIAVSSSQRIDPMSKNCISCHDGSYSTSATVMAGTWSHGRDFIRYDGGSHPIGVDYEAARLQRGRKSDLRPIGMVDRRIRFFEGKVGCGSCHDPYSKIHKQLVMSDVQSRLCFSCHMMDRR